MRTLFALLLLVVMTQTGWAYEDILSNLSWMDPPHNMTAWKKLSDTESACYHENQKNDCGLAWPLFNLLWSHRDDADPKWRKRFVSMGLTADGEYAEMYWDFLLQLAEKEPDTLKRYWNFLKPLCKKYGIPKPH